ncbi:MAG: glycosyltransferase family 39 protein [Bacteroidota bacterium]|nr:glycosyltransferase family 39 protein [Bacteroidota bacterium]MDP4232662.1 glycosyltransferase family 39 protein [Bacteroidota bacterium]MDP4243205.1 glycosyltransferase family 39 protein [Bacteroidota bacterium]MDP4288417.1 glycosyltransferase family 39 protein [Bacteroidota bacterium]
MRELFTIHYPLSTRWALLFTVGVAALLLLPTIYWPFDYDQGTFAYGGSAILHGQRPYLDFWDIKPPNVFYTYATAFALFGKSVRAIRIFDYLNALLCIALVFLLATRFWKNTPWRHVSAVMASVAFLLQYYIFGHWDTAQAETYSVPFLLLAVLLVLPQRTISETRGLWLRATLAGVCIGITFYFKYPSALFLILAAAVVWTHSGDERQLRWKGITWMLTGFAIAIGAESLYLVANGELLPLWQITTSATSTYVSNNYSGSFTAITNLRTSFHALDIAWFVAAMLGWIYWAFDRDSRAKHTREEYLSLMLLVFGCLIAYIIVQAQNKGFTYHYAVLLPWADLLVGAGIGHIGQLLSKRDTLPVWANATVLAILLCLLSYAWTSRADLHTRAHEFGAMVRGETPPNGYVAGDSLTNFVLANTKPSDRIFIFGFAPYVYWKSGRQPANEYLNTIHFKPIGAPKHERDELVTSLIRNPPELFLVETADRYTSQGNTNDDSRTTIALRYPELEQLLQDRYVARDTIQSTIAYQLRH